MRQLATSLVLALSLIGCGVAHVMRPGAIALALMVSLAGCGFLGSQPVKLLTASGPQGVHGCCVPVVSGLLLPDEEFGTVINVDGEGQTVVGIRLDGGLNFGDTEAYLRPVEGGRILLVTWPQGYTGRQVGSEVEVLNASGEVVATTGRRYVCAQHVDGSWSACAAAEATGDPP